MSGLPASAKDAEGHSKRGPGDILHIKSVSETGDDDDVDKDVQGPCDRLSFDVGVCENRNSRYRPTMEDVHTYVANFAERLDWGYFAVFDGHAGKHAARWCGSNLHNILVDKIMDNDNLDLRENLNNSFMEADAKIGQELQGTSGCTAAVAVLRWEEEIDDTPAEEEVDPQTTPFDFVPTHKHRRVLYTANVGDSRLVLCRGGQAVRLSYDHKSTDRLEQQRIIDSGGIMLKNRVNGVLAVTRSLGDVYMKSLVIGAPYTTCTELSEQDEFLILACDGLWDVCSDQEAVDLVKSETDPYKASEMLCKLAINQMSTDNVTAMVVRFDTRVFGYSEPLSR
ncbi:hypothetical protein OGAPHI_004941 [Ogataea philodendri]|uniref:PPM-type phosphatase domain-containing protein n=1 Tax=Ogataea philodendri TaxID=1378263 RepID=A0A9P8P1G9_9ASCO|nr:uncharacterized protein OGAPHI_004941 [Ogataea philodendri]KAH3663540.1 hypothetical protein OGAPHI_004941 [Ogataea philodendri]